MLSVKFQADKINGVCITLILFSTYFLLRKIFSFRLLIFNVFHVFYDN